MRRFGLIAVPVVAAAALLVAGCGHYSDKTVSPLPNTVEGAAKPASATTTAATAAQGDPAAGKTVFASNGCGACHTLAAAGAAGKVGPSLDATKPALALVLDRLNNGKLGMPKFKGNITDAQIQDVAAYVVQATSGG